MIKAVLFDLTYTLIHYPNDGRKATAEKCAELLSQYKPVDAAWVRAQREKYHHELSTGAIDEHEMWTLITQEHEINDAALVEKLVALQHAENAELYEDAEPAMELLKKHGLKIGVLANSRKPNERHVQELLAGKLDAIVFSHRIGARKPHRITYLELCKQLGVTPQECFFVSDEIYEDLWGAARLGMKTAHVERQRQGGVYLVNPDWKAIKPDIESSSLEEISNKILAMA